MGNPTFWYYPTPDGTKRHTIDLGEPLAEMFSDFEVDSATAVSFDSQMYRTTGLHREVVTIQRDRFKLGEDLAYKLHALQNHLDRGYSVSFSADSAKSFCFPLSLNPSSGDHRVNVLGDPFRGMTGSAIPATGEIMVLESQNPQLLYEQHKMKANNTSTPAASLTTSGGGTMNIEPAVAFTQSTASFIRYYRFFPVLKRPNADVGKAIITNEGGRLFSLNVRLVVDYQTLFSHHPNVQSYPVTDPQWADEVEAWTGVEKIPIDPDFVITLDQPDPRWTMTLEKKNFDPYAGMYPDKPDTSDK